MNSFLPSFQEHRHTMNVQKTMKFLQDGSGAMAGGRRWTTLKSVATASVAGSMMYQDQFFENIPSFEGKEQQLLELLRLIGRQDGAWGVFEDEDLIVSNLTQLSQLLTLLDSRAIKRVARADSYKNVKRLCRIFEIEKRASVRMELLSVLEIIGIKDRGCMGIIMQSDLLMDLIAYVRIQPSNFQL